MYEPLESVMVPAALPDVVGAFDDDHSVDFDSRVQHFMLALSEHKAVRPYLDKYNLHFITMPEGKLGIVEIGEIDARVLVIGMFQLAIWRDPAIRPLFDQYHLTVYEGG